MCCWGLGRVWLGWRGGAAALADWQSQAGGAAAAVAGDITDRGALPTLLDQITQPFGPPDIVVHAAGLNTREAADDVTPDGWDRTLAVNLSAPFFLSQALVPAMKAKGWGRIVLFASLQTTRAFPGGYCLRGHQRAASVR